MPGQSRSISTLDLVGGTACLDFVNTINSRTAPEYDYLRDYAHFIAWAALAGILSDRQAARLRDMADQDVNHANGAFVKALQYREIIYQLFRKIARKIEPNPVELKLIMHLYADAITHGAFIRQADYFAVEWEPSENLESPLWPILHSAKQILCSAELAQVKECPNCGWLFVDRSKNQSRKWCSMATCGVKDKMRRYQKKQRVTNP